MSSDRQVPAALIANQRPGRPNPNRGKRFPVEVLTQVQVRALFAACPPTGPAGIRNRAMLAVLYRAGLRCAECLDLYPQDLDLEQHAIAVMCGKGSKRRTVGIDPPAVELIDAWLEARAALDLSASAPLFCTVQGRNAGGPLYSSYLRNLLPRLAAQAGIGQRVHPHCLRHTHAYELAVEGVPYHLIQKQLGHANLWTTARYLDHFAPGDVLAITEARDWTP